MLCDFIRKMFPNFRNDAKVRDIWAKASRLNDSLFGEDEARGWANDFRISNTVVDKFEERFRSVNFDFARLIRSVKDEVRHVRISGESVSKMLSRDNPDFDKMLELADVGMKLFLDPNFEANGPDHLPKLSQAYVRVSSAVNKSLVEDYLDKGLAFILSKECCIRHLPSFHVSRVSWTTKPNKAKGRTLVDCSAGVGNRKLNSIFTKLSADKYYGQIKHPNISDIANMIWKFWLMVLSRGGSWSELRMYKEDLMSAYNLLWFAEQWIHYIGAELTNDLLIFFLCGIFGWSATPAAFQVVTRALLFEFKKFVSGGICMYVDDIIGVSLECDVANDVAAVRNFCDQLFNANSIADEKVEVGRSIDCLGYFIDLDQRIISVSEKNYLKCFHGFISVDLSQPVELKVIERFASWAVRYCEIFILLKPYVHTFYEMLRGSRNRYKKLWVPPEVFFAAQIFKAIFIMSVCDEVNFSRPISSFVKSHCDIVIQFDASLTGGGLLFYEVMSDLSLMLKSAIALDFGFFDFTGSQYQNLAEFLAAVVGVHIVASRYRGARVIELRGDSKSALKWMGKGRSNCEWTSRLGMVLIHLLFKYDILVADVVHVPGVENVLADALSRGKSVSECCSDVEMLSYDMEGLFKLSLLGEIPSNEDEFFTFWNSINVL